MRAIHGRFSGLCQPAYVLDIPGGHGKSPIGPNYLTRVGERTARRAGVGLQRAPPAIRRRAERFDAFRLGDRPSALTRSDFSARSHLLRKPEVACLENTLVVTNGCAARYLAGAAPMIMKTA